MKMVDISPMSIVAQVLGRDPTLTGRKDLIWDVLLPMALQHPAVGQGYGSFWIRPVPGLILDINEAHNGYLDVFIELGGVGLILLIPVLVAYFRKARNEMERDFNWAAFRISFLVMFLLHNCTETTWLRSREILWNLFVFFFVVFPKEWTGCHLEENVSADEVPAQVGAAPAVSPVGVTDSVLDHGMVDAEQGLHKC
jgi:O-antigen ligase